MSSGVHLQVAQFASIGRRVFAESLEEERFFEPLYAFRDGANRPRRNFCVDAVVQALVQMAFDRLLVLHHLDVVVHLLEQREVDRFAVRVVLGTTCATEDLLHVEHAHIFVGSCRRGVYLCALNQHGVSWQVHTPGKGGRRAQNLDLPVVKQIFNHGPVFSEHTCVVHTHAVLEQLFYLFVAGGIYFSLGFPGVLAVEQMGNVRSRLYNLN